VLNTAGPPIEAETSPSEGTGVGAINASGSTVPLVFARRAGAPARELNDVSTETSLITTRDAAALLHLRPQTLEVWRVRGEGPPFLKLGRRTVRYELQTVLRWAGASGEPPARPRQPRRPSCPPGRTILPGQVRANRGPA